MSTENNKQASSSKTSSVEWLITKPEDIDKVIKGIKTATRRNGRYANVGEIMNLDDQQFLIERVYTQKLGDLTDDDARQEGFRNLEEYKESILSLHPGMRWAPKMEVWVHEFAPVEQ